MNINIFDQFKASEHFAEDKAKRTFSPKLKPKRTFATTPSLKVAGEQLGEIQRSANQARKEGTGPSLTQTRQQEEGTPEHFMAANDVLEVGQPTGGVNSSPARDALRSEILKLADPKTGNFAPGTLNALKNELSKAKAEGRSVSVNDIRRLTGQDTDPVDEGATIVSEMARQSASVPARLAGAAASSGLKEALGDNHPVAVGADMAGQFAGQAISGLGELSSAVQWAEDTANEGASGGLRNLLFNLIPVGASSALKLGGKVFKSAREYLQALKVEEPGKAAQIDEALKAPDLDQQFQEVLDRRQQILSDLKANEGVEQPGQGVIDTSQLQPDARIDRSAFTDNLKSQETPMVTEPGPKFVTKPAPKEIPVKSNSETVNSTNVPETGTAKEPWQMTREELDALSYDDFRNADRAVGRKWGDLYWARQHGNISDADAAILARIDEQSHDFHEVGKKHIAEREARQAAANQVIEAGEPWRASREHFVGYHKTGSIESRAYERYATSKGIDFVKRDQYPIQVDQIEVNGKTLDIRQENEPLRYVKEDADGNIVRDANGMATYLSPEEMKAQGYPSHSAGLAVFDGDRPVGFASNEFGTAGVWVVDEFQGKGIGARLLDDFMQRHPRIKKIGQMTPSGEKMTGAYHKRLVAQALSEGKPVPPEILADYPDLAKKYAQETLPSPYNSNSVEAVKSGDAAQGQTGVTASRGVHDRQTEVDVRDPGNLDTGRSGLPNDTGASTSAGNGVESKPGDVRATGIANQVQSREAEAGLINQVAKGTGKSPQEWHEIGRKRYEAGEDWESLAKDIADGKKDANPSDMALLSFGKADYMRRMAPLREKALAGDKEARADLDKLQEQFDEFAKNVQAGKGVFGDFGRALQIGVGVDTGDFESVIQHLRERGVKPDPKVEAELQKTAKELADTRAELDRLKANPAEFTAQQALRQAPRARRFDRASAQKRIDENLQKLKELKPTAGVGSNKQRGAVSITVDDLKRSVDQLKLVKDITLDWARINIGANLEDAILGVQGIFKAQGIDIDRDAIVHALNHTEPGTPMSDSAKSALNVKRQAVAEGNLAEKEANLAAPRSFNVVKRAKVKTVDAHLEDLKAKERLLDSRIRNKIREQQTPRVKRWFNTGVQTVRGTILGSDIGVLTRQGLFSLARPKSFLKGIGQGAKAALSEENLAKWANDQDSARMSDGKLAISIEKEAGLSTTDALNSHEEAILGQLFRKIPGIGKLAGGLERFQTVFINTVRKEIFRASYEKGLTMPELQARARFINNATGRGNIKNVPSSLQAILTSPRYEASRWAMIGEAVRNPVEALANKGSRQNLQDMAVTAAGVYALFKASELAGYTVDFDPQSSDFLKMRKGNEVWDVSAGLAPRLRDVLRVALAAKASATGQKTPFGQGFGDIAQKALTRTVSPAVKTPVDETVKGIARANGVSKPVGVIQPYPDNMDGWAWNFAPLIVQSFAQALGEEGPAAAVQAGLKEFVGTSVNRYPKTEGKKKLSFTLKAPKAPKPKFKPLK